MQRPWRGTVYVACNVQVYPWEELPTFLKDCDLEIEPDTVVYVAYHNDPPTTTAVRVTPERFAEP